jgi:hypothetical protein
MAAGSLRLYHLRQKERQGLALNCPIRHKGKRWLREVEAAWLMQAGVRDGAYGRIMR